MTRTMRRRGEKPVKAVCGWRSATRTLATLARKARVAAGQGVTSRMFGASAGLSLFAVAGANGSGRLGRRRGAHGAGSN
jgi:hypothetical protein